MSDHDAKSHGILRWLGLGGALRDGEIVEADAAAEPA
jgi:hypothetical protein